MTIFKPMVVPLAQKSGEICTGQFILQPIPLKSDRLLCTHVVKKLFANDFSIAHLVQANLIHLHPLT